MREKLQDIVVSYRKSNIHITEVLERSKRQDIIKEKNGIKFSHALEVKLTSKNKETKSAH